ncbi:MAG: hypothetical protein N3E45_14205 [Oscillatoriaceae bacterium SKW80]|nr:hypothetical protein [Oscillatoriaceae bacterium SKW80]HIK29104.1 hypothetical protein [Oscillatoriaceae cyanobacterium M7585_C2015_266]
MLLKVLERILIASLTFSDYGAHTALSQTIFPPTLITQPTPSKEIIFFKCIPYGNDYFITVVQKGKKEAALFLWERENFDIKISQEKACNNLSQRLNEKVAENGGNFKSLFLTMGRVSGETVMCIVNNSRKGCNQENIIFSLNKKDAERYARKPEEFLIKLTGVNPQGCESNFFQLAGNPSFDINRQPYLNLEVWENQFFGAKFANKINHYKCALPGLENR